MVQATGLLVMLGLLPTGAQGPSQVLVEGPVVLFIGPPGSGKSTQAQVAAKQFGLPVVSAENMIQSNPGAFQKNREPRISGMEPHSDPAMNKVFLSTLEKGSYPKGLILDGYPATKDHGDFLAKLAGEGRLPKPIVIQLEVSDEQVRKRMKAQAGEALEQRIKDYHREMDMVQLYFPNAEIVKIDGGKKTSSVTKAVGKALKERLKK